MPYSGDAELAAVVLELRELRRRLVVDDRQRRSGMVGMEWSIVATVRSGRRTLRPRARSPVKACGEVTSWTRCRST